MRHHLQQNKRELTNKFTPRNSTRPKNLFFKHRSTNRRLHNKHPLWFKSIYNPRKPRKNRLINLKLSQTNISPKNKRNFPVRNTPHKILKNFQQQLNFRNNILKFIKSKKILRPTNNLLQKHLQNPTRPKFSPKNTPNNLYPSKLSNPILPQRPQPNQFFTQPTKPISNYRFWKLRLKFSRIRIWELFQRIGVGLHLQSTPLLQNKPRSRPNL